MPDPSSRPSGGSGSSKSIAVVIEPRAPHTDGEILELLHNENVVHTQLAPGYISATVPTALLPRLETMAEVTAKARKKPY